MKKLSVFIVGHSKLVIGIVILLTIIFAWQANDIEQRIDLEENMPEDDLRLSTFTELRDRYSQEDEVTFILTGDNVLSPESLAIVDKITDDFLNHPQIKEVTSLTNLSEFVASEEGISSAQLIEDIPQNEQEARQLRKKILSDPWYVNRLVSQDGQSTIIQFQPIHLDFFEERLALFEDALEIISKNKGNLQINFAGPMAIDYEGDKILGKDLQKLLPMVLLLTLIILFISFRSIRGVLLPTITVILSVIWTIGFMALVNRPLSTITNIMPILLIGVGSAYGIHIIARYREGLSDGLEKRQALMLSVEQTGIGVWLAAITTMVGFGSLALSDFKMIWEFGIFSAFGVFSAFVISVTFIPAVLNLLPALKIKKTGKVTRSRSLLLPLSNLIIDRKKTILSIALLLISISAIGWPMVKTEISMTDIFPHDSELIKTEKIIDERYGGSSQFIILAKGDLNNLELLKQMESYQEEMVKLGTGQPTSVVDMLKRLNRAFHEGKEEYEALPDNPELVPQLLFLLEISARPGDLEGLMNFDQTEALIYAPISSVMGFGEKKELVEQLELKAKEIFTGGNQAIVSGVPVAELAAVDIIDKEQLQNIFASVIAVFIIMLIAFRSLSVGICCMVSIIFTIVFNFGLMGFLGIPLNYLNMIIASLATGIGIDYSIHFYIRYKEELRLKKSFSKAVRETIRTTGTAIIANALSVGMGFAVLLFSQVNMFRQFGGLITLTMLVTATGALTILPLVIYLFLKGQGLRTGNGSLIGINGENNVHIES